MNQSLSICSVGAACDVRGGLIGRRLLAIVAGVAIVGAAVALQQGHARLAPESAMGPRIIVVQAATVPDLRDRAEALRADMLSRPGVRAVTIQGLRQQSLAVEYTPRHLAAYGVRPADLVAALPVDAQASRAGHLALLADAPGLEMQTVLDTPVRAGRRVFRLGDVALVTRDVLTPPVSTLQVGGQPAARLIVQ